LVLLSSLPEKQISLDIIGTKTFNIFAIFFEFFQAATFSHDKKRKSNLNEKKKY